jgi:uncharacterized protein
MLYRPFGRTGLQVSALGFGCMRLPVVDRQREKIDMPLATNMLHYAIEHGVNYVDTAFPYHGLSFSEPGNSEVFVGQALQGGYRDKVYIATKLPVWIVESREDMDRILDGQLERMQTDHVDCYLMHGLNGKVWPKMVELGAIDFLNKAKADGRIGYAGFSFHDDPPAFAPIVDGYAWDFCQIQYNYMDVKVQAGEAGLAYAAAKGMGVIVMEPVKGGLLATAPPPIQALWDTADIKLPAVEWALRFVLDDARVSVLLSGMSTMEQVVENVRVTSEVGAGSLTAAERELIAKVRQAYEARTAVDCTGCRYCQPCPQGIDIPMIFSVVNEAALFDDPTRSRIGYHIGLEQGRTAPYTACTECGTCEEHCPQQLKIPEELIKAGAILD